MYIQLASGWPQAQMAQVDSHSQRQLEWRYAKTNVTSWLDLRLIVSILGFRVENAVQAFVGNFQPLDVHKGPGHR